MELVRACAPLVHCTNGMEERLKTPENGTKYADQNAEEISFNPSKQKA
jgi:hypothetical protein